MISQNLQYDLVERTIEGNCDLASTPPNNNQKFIKHNKPHQRRLAPGTNDNPMVLNDVDEKRLGFSTDVFHDSNKHDTVQKLLYHR